MLWNFITSCLSVAALSFSFYSFRTVRRAESRPVLVFTNAESIPDGESTTWTVENVGKGPAINVLLGGKNDQDIWAENEWTAIPVLAVGKPLRLNEWKSRKAFVAYYEDSLGNPHKSYCEDHTNTVTENAPKPSGIRAARSLWSLRMQALKSSRPNQRTEIAIIASEQSGKS